jgi:hypothetical protein
VSYRLTILKKQVTIKVINLDLPPTSEEVEEIIKQHPGSTYDICRVELTEDDFDYRQEDL